MTMISKLGKEYTKKAKKLSDLIDDARVPSKSPARRDLYTYLSIALLCADLDGKLGPLLDMDALRKAGL